MKISTRQKAAAGYLILALLLVATVYAINIALNALTSVDSSEQLLAKRQRTTNNVVVKLYTAEIIGQAVSAGEIDALPEYADAMMAAAEAVDSLRPLMSDTLQLARLDSVCQIMAQKADNMNLLVEAITEDNSDELYQSYINDLASQNEAMRVPSVRKTEEVTTSDYVVHHKRKNFFGRLRDAFSSGKTDSTRVSSVTKEERSDTILSSYNPADTVARILTNVHRQISSSRLEQARQMRLQVEQLRLAGLELSEKVSQLLNAIVDDSDEFTATRHAQEERIRHRAAMTISIIAWVAAALAIAFLIIIWRDITHSNHYRQELEKAKKKAEDLLAVREKLMLAITHDIKAPVGSIIGYSDLLKHVTKEDRQLFYLENMHTSAEHLLRLVNSLLDFHRLDANKMDASEETFNPRQLLDTIAVSFRPLAADKGLRLDYKCSARLDAPFASDPFRIRQIVENLMSNALKFTREGSITLSAEIDDDRNLRILVADTGCGIARKEQKRIFQEFTRLSDAQGQEGFGLGLSITEKLVALLGGEITVESEPGKGSEFRVSLPLRAASSAASSSAEEQAAPETPRKPKVEGVKNVLLIDDDRLQMQLTVAMLQSVKVKAECCETPEELFAKIGERAFDAVLTDIQMPAMNGFDLLRAIRALPAANAKTIPVVAITARSDMDSDTLRPEGFAGCLHKPFSVGDLCAALNAAVRPLPTYDFSTLTAFSADDKEAAAEIMRAFVDETGRNIERLERALNASDMKEAAETAHKMLPLFTMIGATAAIEPLTALERKRGIAGMTAADREMAEAVVAEARLVVAAAKI